MNVQDPNQVVFQLGKKGITKDFLDNIKRSLNNKKQVKIKFLKSSLEKTNKNEHYLQITRSLGILMEYQLIGNTLFIKKTRK